MLREFNLVGCSYLDIIDTRTIFILLSTINYKAPRKKIRRRDGVLSPPFF
jgi:hypothetical protein